MSTGRSIPRDGNYSMVADLNIKTFTLVACGSLVCK
jgi:hypothetical protein